MIIGGCGYIKSYTVNVWKTLAKYIGYVKQRMEFWKKACELDVF